MDCFGTYFTHAQTCNVTCAVSPSNVFHPDALDWLDSELQEEKSAWNTQKNLTKVHKSKKALKHRTVGSANVPVWAKSYMNEIDGFSVLLTFPKPKANRSRKRRQFDDFSLLQGVASLRPIHSYKTACTTTRICSMCFAREENAITRKWQNQKHCPSIRRNMQALPPREEWPCCNGATKTDWKNLAGTQAKVQGLQKGARQLRHVSRWEKHKAKPAF